MAALNVSAPSFSNSTPGSILEMRLQNAGDSQVAAGYTTTLGVFTKGEIPQGGSVVAQVGGELVTAQVDVKTRHADGSAETAVVTFHHAAVAAGASVDVVLMRGAASGLPAVDLAARLDGYSLEARIDPEGPAGVVSVDLVAALKTAIANGTASFWQQGSEAATARVEVAVGGAMRLVADITATADGKFASSVQFANDIAMGATGGTQRYAATLVEDGRTVFQQNLIATGMVANYDIATGVSESLLQRMATQADQPGFHDVLGTAGVTQYMPMTGGRGDIGMTTVQNSAWLITQDARAAEVALAQAEAGGTVPWRHWDAANGTWLNTDNYPRLWTDGRGGTGTPGDRNSGGLTQQSENGGWTPETAHQPDLSYVPYLLTGDRYYLDNLQAQAAWSIMSTWTYPRQDGKDLVVNENQVRGAAWSLRELVEAAAVSPEGSKEKTFFTTSVNENLDFIVSRIPQWTVDQGETHGRIPGSYGNNSLPPWQQDHMATTIAAAIRIGDAEIAGKATEILKWMENFLVGRFEHAADGFNPRDGVGYNITMATTWAGSGAATVANGQSNGTGWSQSQGNYGQLALNTLAILSEVLDSTRAKAAYDWLKGSGAPYISAQNLSDDPLNLTTPDSVYEANPQVPVSPYTEGADQAILSAPVQGGTVDMLGGFDTLTLTSPQGNTLTVANTEMVLGSAGDDTVTVATPGAVILSLGEGRDHVTLGVPGIKAVLTGVESVTGSQGDDTVFLQGGSTGMTIDLGAGKDRVEIGASAAAGAANSVTLSGVEEVIGSDGRDVVRLTGGSYVDLGDGNDRLELSATAANTVTVLNTEAILGGAKADVVTLGTAADGVSIDLGNGMDTLFLWDGAARNSVLLSNVENVIGYSGDDTVTLRTGARGGSVDLGGGKDLLVLSDLGNTLKVTNVEEIRGGAGADGITVTGSVAARILAGAGADVITGGSGNDVIVGGLGKDVMTGGAGADSFVFTRIADSDLNTRDIINDFAMGQDKLVFQGLLHGTFQLTVEQAFTAFQANGNSQAHFVDSTDQLLIDSNGDGAMDMRMTLTGVSPNLAATDFVWS